VDIHPYMRVNLDVITGEKRCPKLPDLSEIPFMPGSNACLVSSQQYPELKSGGPGCYHIRCRLKDCCSAAPPPPLDTIGTYCFVMLKPPVLVPPPPH